jgi:hypothetical protein
VPNIGISIFIKKRKIIEVATVFQKSLPSYFTVLVYCLFLPYEEKQNKNVSIFCLCMQKVCEMDSVWLGACGCF